jgi:uncharacterized iron-regulated membrane protein
MTARKLIFWIHLPVGVTAGLVILVMSVTGAVLALQRPAIAWAERSFRSTLPAGGAPRLSAERLLEKMRADRPSARPSAITVQADPAAPVVVGLGREGSVLLDAYRGAELGTGARRTRAFFQSVVEWHRFLAMEGESRPVGKAITGAANLAFLVVVVTGPVLWWPRGRARGRFKNVALFQGGLAGRGRDFNWHNVLGIWSAAPLLVMVATAVVMSYGWANTLVFRMAGSEPPRPPAGRAGAESGGDRARGERPAAEFDASGLDAAFARARGQVDGWQTITVRLAGPPAAPFAFTIDQGRGGVPSERAQLTVDRRNAVASWEPYASQSLGRRLRAWARFSHTGEAFGPLGQVVAGLASAAGVVLVCTGLAMALRRFAAWRVRRARSGIEIATTQSLSQAS